MPFGAAVAADKQSLASCVRVAWLVVGRLLHTHFLWIFMFVVECFTFESKSDTICPPVPSDANGMGATGLSFSRLPPLRASFFEPTVLRGVGG